MPEVTPGVEARLAEIRDRAREAEDEPQEPGPATCRSQEDIPPLVAAVEAALRAVGESERQIGEAPINGEPVVAGAVVAVQAVCNKVREAISEALTGHTKERGDRG